MTGFEDDDLLDFNEYSDDNVTPEVEDDMFSTNTEDNELSSIEDDLFGGGNTEKLWN